MDPQLWIQLGIGGLTLFILYDYLKRTDTRIDARDKSFANFVDEHNHVVGELMRESTQTMKEVKETIQEHTNVLKSLIK